jgi:DNA-directed RNA polymerase specialized sigma24 family protein
MNGGSVTHWIHLLQDGDHAAAQALWERYFVQLESVARGRLRGATLAIADAEDVALSAFDSLFRALEGGRLPQLRDRDNLFRLLIVITARKVAHLLRDQRRQKRGGERSKLSSGGDPSVDLEQVIGHAPTPEFALQVVEEADRLLGRLPDSGLQQVAIWKMEGYTNAEIAAKLGCAPRTVDRKLRLIRHLWEQEIEA